MGKGSAGRPRGCKRAQGPTLSPRAPSQPAIPAHPGSASPDSLIAPGAVFSHLSSWGRSQLLPSLFATTMAEGPLVPCRPGEPPLPQATDCCWQEMDPCGSSLGLLPSSGFWHAEQVPACMRGTVDLSPSPSTSPAPLLEQPGCGSEELSLSP